MVTIQARPQAVTLDSARTGVLVVDMQNDFGTEAACSREPGSTYQGSVL
jgi:hypothetical protein